MSRFAGYQTGLWLFVAGLFFASGPISADDWRQFRGPNCSGLAASNQRLPCECSSTKNVCWSAKLADAVSSPTVAAGRVFTTAMIGPREGPGKFAVYAFDASSGRKLWQREFPTGSK